MSRSRSNAPAAILAAALAGCSAQAPEPASPPPAEALPPASAGSDCGAGQLGDYVGRKATDEVIAAIRAWRGDHPVRVLKPGAIVTMDYRPDRLNIEVDEDGLIKSLRCT